MKKTRMSIDDIYAIVGSLRKNVVNMRVTNIYDVKSANESSKSKIYILKLHQPPYPKVYLLLESGVRFHTSKYARTASSAESTSRSLPSQFTMKLRKHLRGKRLTELKQLQGDRVVDFTFGNGEFTCHLILELYASGNIILTDANYTVLSLLRTHKFDEDVKLVPKQIYPIEMLDNNAASTSSIKTVPKLRNYVDNWFTAYNEKIKASENTKKNKMKAVTLKQLLLTKESTFGELGPVIIEHCIVSTGLVASMKFKAASDFQALDDDLLAKLILELKHGWDLLTQFQVDQNIFVHDKEEDSGDAKKCLDELNDDNKYEKKCGYIISNKQSNPGDLRVFEEFTPYLYAQHQRDDKDIQSFDTFDDAVDEYFSHYETQQAAVAQEALQKQVEGKLNKLKQNQKQQIDQLLNLQETKLKHAHLIEANQQDIENALLVIRSALASGMDWRGLEELVKSEQKNGNPIACLIHELDLKNNKMCLLLCDDEETDGDVDVGDDEDSAAHAVWIDISLSALANAREIYTAKKKASANVKKATEATDKAIEIATKKTTMKLQKQQMKPNPIFMRRKVFWFEKFHWFLSNENYLVIAGKDAQQNESLVKRYLRKGDIYVHADLHGAATCVVRHRANMFLANEGTTPPVATLEQAGCMSVCRSNAWSSQVTAGAYWVYAEQVSKSAPSGEYLTTGSFMIRGKKNFIPPSRLEMGLAILFRLDTSDQQSNEKNFNIEQSINDTQQQSEKKMLSPDLSENTSDSFQNAEAYGVKSLANAAPITEESFHNSNVKNDETTSNTNSEIISPEISEMISQAKPSGKIRISAKARRDLKKSGGQNGSTGTVNSSNSLEKVEDTGKSVHQTNVTKNAKGEKSKNNTQVRGKKGKLRKMKAKYADQDEEDRRIRMEALGHKFHDSMSESEKEGNITDEDISEQSEKSGNITNKMSFAHENEENIRIAQEKKEKYLENEQDETMDEGTAFLDSFSGNPSPQDTLICALPMCAPYSSLQKYKYKVKLTPGSQKKGKAARTTMDYFFSMILNEEKKSTSEKQMMGKNVTTTESESGENNEDISPNVDSIIMQKEMIKFIPENDYINCMVGPVKIGPQNLQTINSKGGKGSNKKQGKSKK